MIKGRLATKEDARAGRAVFYIENTDLPGAAPLSVQLPALALVKDEESGEDTVVIAIQAEQTSAQENSWASATSKKEAITSERL